VTTSFVKQLFEVEYPQQYLCSLKEIIIGASYSSPALLGKLTGLTRAQIVIDYGSSETGAVAHAPYRPGTDFPAGYLGEFSRPDLDLKFYDEALRELQGVSEGLAGFGFANYPSKRYLLDNTEEKFGFHGNVFIPGDLLRREGNGLYYLGRAQNVVNIGGEKHSLDIIQQVLDHAFPEFLTMAVIARDPQGEECLVVCHTARADLPRDVFREALHQRLEGYIDLVPMRLEAMPLTGTGKIDRRGLVGIAQSRLTPDANQ
jgi:acyl-coenzyme A synthetase/AMP-(fatty) acid ligase